MRPQYDFIRSLATMGASDFQGQRRKASAIVILTVYCWGVARRVEHLSNVHEALESIFSTKLDWRCWPISPAFGKERKEDQRGSTTGQA